MCVCVETQLAAALCVCGRMFCLFDFSRCAIMNTWVCVCVGVWECCRRLFCRHRRLPCVSCTVLNATLFFPCRESTCHFSVYRLRNTHTRTKALIPYLVTEWGYPFDLLHLSSIAPLDKSHILYIHTPILSFRGEDSVRFNIMSVDHLTRNSLVFSFSLLLLLLSE